MPHSRSPEDMLHAQRTLWHGRLQLQRSPVCPGCAQLLHPQDITFVTGLAFCTPCGSGELYACLKIAQTMLHPRFAPHATVAHGLHFYTPTTAGPPLASELAERLGIGHIYAILPIAPSLERLPRTLPNIPNPPNATHAPDR